MIGPNGHDMDKCECGRNKYSSSAGCYKCKEKHERKSWGNGGRCARYRCSSRKAPGKRLCEEHAYRETIYARRKREKRGYLTQDQMWDLQTWALENEFNSRQLAFAIGSNPRYAASILHSKAKAPWEDM
jgi:hypothetical protein